MMSFYIARHGSSTNPWRMLGLHSYLRYTSPDLGRRGNCSSSQIPASSRPRLSPSDPTCSLNTSNMAGTRRSARISSSQQSQESSPPAKQASPNGTSQKRKADTGSSPVAKRGKKGAVKEQKTLEEVINKCVWSQAFISSIADVETVMIPSQSLIVTRRTRKPLSRSLPTSR